jgi:hypothetical protein
MPGNLAVHSTSVTLLVAILSITYAGLVDLKDHELNVIHSLVAAS